MSTNAQSNTETQESAHARILRRIAVILGAIVIALFVSLGATGTASAALRGQSVSYLPGVSAEMMNAKYWSDKQQNPDEVLMDRATIDAVNQAGIDGDYTMLQPLKTASGDYYSKERQEALKGSIVSNLKNYQAQGAHDENDNPLTDEEVAAIASNCPDDGRTPQIAQPYAIVTTHTTMRSFPTDHMIGLTPGDNDDDNLYLAALRVNEPLLIRAQSVDGKFFLCISTCLNPAWVPAEDVAICQSKEEWLAAWDIPEGKELVVTDYKVRTEQTREAPNTANRLLYMGTVLERVDIDSPEKALEIVGTRSAFNNHVCYLPVRQSDGTYAKELALIAESANVSEGYLPLTKANVATVAFRSLGQMYGWGGMLEANDCSGYVRDVYKCFGLELPRNTSWQPAMPVCKYDLSGLDDAHKAAAIAQMPLGTVLFFGEHEMIYLGQENNKLYVISSLGGIGNLYNGDKSSYQVKSVAVNTLDMVRGNGSTWLQNLTVANVPYISEAKAKQGAKLHDIAFYDGGITWPNPSYTYTGKAIAPSVEVPGLAEGADYEVAFSNNTNIGTATVKVTGKGEYTGSATRTFQIVSDKAATTPISGAQIAVQDQIHTGTAHTPEPTVTLGSALLSKGRDYDVAYANNVDAGTATLTITGKGAYSGTASKTFNIFSESLAAAQITVANQTYTGAPIEPAPVVHLGTIELVRDVDYTVSYIDNVAVGTAVVVVSGKGNFDDSGYATFSIGKASQKIKAKNAKKTLKASKKTKRLTKKKVVNLKKVAKVSAKTKMKFKKANKAGGSYITVNSKTGKVTAKKGLKKGTYKVKVKVKAAGDENYEESETMTVTFKVKVK